MLLYCPQVYPSVIEGRLEGMVNVSEARDPVGHNPGSLLRVWPHLKGYLNLLRLMKKGAFEGGIMNIIISLGTDHEF